MAGSSGVLRKVLRLKLQLKEPAGPDTVLKTLQKLSDLDITLDILTETGIGKVVNSLRRHEEAGELAKSLVKDWKKLLCNTSHTEDVANGISQTHKLDDHKGSDKKGFGEDDFNNNCLTSKSLESEDEYTHRKENKKRKREENQRDAKNSREKVQREKEIFKDGDSDSRSNDRASRRTESKTRTAVFDSCQSSKKSRPRETSQDKRPDVKPLKSPLKVDSAHNREATTELRSSERKHKKGKDEKNKSKERSKMKHRAKESEQDMSLSFESFLNYDQHLSRKRCAVKKPTRKTEVKKKSAKTPEAVKSPERTARAASPQKSFIDNLINVPLPAVLLDYDNASSFDYYERKVEKKSCEVLEDPTTFTGQRLNKKMQVYSGAKTMFLPTMMSLYQQCIRTLQNNIDLLFETGGVPFEVLEPVLDRCTPEQLLRIEEFNPMYIGETDHLWGKHCRRDFKDSKLLEYESWKEMYIRLSEEREKKFQRLKKSIASAHSKKPQGRQVKMAFIHTVAKPPRDVRIQQELHGTAVQQPSCSVKTHDIRPVQKTEPTRLISASAGTSNNQDLRKKIKVAPMMAKSLKAFKKQMGRR